MSVFLTTFVVIGLYFAFSVIIIRHEYVNYPETNRQYSCLSTICGYIFLLTLLIKIVRHPRIQTQTHSIHTEWNTTTNDDVGRKLHKICAVCVCVLCLFTTNIHLVVVPMPATRPKTRLTNWQRNIYAPRHMQNGMLEGAMRLLSPKSENQIESHIFLAAECKGNYVT